MIVDVIYLAWNRLEFTRCTFDTLLATTDWDLVSRLFVYEDGSTDGTREYLEEAIERCPVEHSLSYLGFGSPVATMRHYLSGSSADAFAKIDSDIACPPGWLGALVEVMEASPELELLGMAAGWTGVDALFPLGEPRHAWWAATHIGGVGLMRVEAFHSRPFPEADGRFGFTEWQQRWEPVRGWIVPDLPAPQLDLIPEEPWASLAAEYVERGWARPWPPYDSASHRWWDWISGEEAMVA